GLGADVEYAVVGGVDGHTGDRRVDPGQADRGPRLAAVGAAGHAPAIAGADVDVFHAAGGVVVDEHAVAGAAGTVGAAATAGGGRVVHPPAVTPDGGVPRVRRVRDDRLSGPASVDVAHGPVPDRRRLSGPHRAQHDGGGCEQQDGDNRESDLGGGRHSVSSMV